MITKGLRITKVYFIIFLCSVLPVAFSCTGMRKAKSTAGDLSIKDSLVLKQSPSPIKLDNSSVKFYKNVSYGNLKENVFDIFLPQSAKPSGLVIYIFGGGFIHSWWRLCCR